MKSSKIQLNLYQVNQFAVFGFNSNSQILEESEIFVKINYSILTGALLCLECDIVIKHSELQFIASGLQLSALIMKSKDIIQIECVNISYRFSCNSSSGIVNQILYDIDIFSIINLTLTGYNDIESTLNGYLSSKVDVDINIQINIMYVCVDVDTQRTGQTLNFVNVSSSEFHTCTQVCSEDQYVTYGLCQNLLFLSTLLSNNTVICDHPFEYDYYSNTCVCKFGYYLNDTVCVHVISEFSQIVESVSLLDLKLEVAIQNTQIYMESLQLELQSNIQNISNLVHNSYMNLKLDMTNINQTLNENLNDLQTNMTQQFKLSSDSNAITQVILNDFKSDTQNNFLLTKTLINDNQLNTKNNFTQTNSQISNLSAAIQNNFSQIITEVYNTNMNIKNNFTQTNQKIDSVNTQINAVVTNSYFQTQIDLLKQQISNISVSSNQSSTSSEYRCQMEAARISFYYMSLYYHELNVETNTASRFNYYNQYVQSMQNTGCKFT
ncbi:Growth_factor receptor cysteine-rich domain superfamily [Hexamita inflata]|uniref:Growth factor receptor cysteine-rich domain superfamily n=1 Tax=Hexamita inflata TaxID=28002 RepID=A0AA86RJ12_9EUKA|nr:Growth factor receptor cysteine-rich domain superfamily [Hexamita inflata]